MARTRTARVLVSLLVCAVVMPAAAYLFGPRGLLAASAVGLLWVASRHDNEVGVCLPLAILFLIVVAVMGLLLWLLVITHPY